MRSNGKTTSKESIPRLGPFQNQIKMKSKKHPSRKSNTNQQPNTEHKSGGKKTTDQLESRRRKKIKETKTKNSLEMRSSFVFVLFFLRFSSVLPVGAADATEARPEAADWQKKKETTKKQLIMWLPMKDAMKHESSHPTEEKKLLENKEVSRFSLISLSTVG